MLPRVDDQQRHRAGADVALVVVDLLDDEAARHGLPRERAPTDALHVDRGGGELGLQGIEGAEVFGDGRVEFAFGLAATVGAHVGPEDAVQHVAADMKGEAARQLVDVAEVALGAGRFQSGERVVGALHIGGVVLGVVQVHDLSAVVGLEGAGGVRQVGKRVSGHAKTIPRFTAS